MRASLPLYIIIIFSYCAFAQNQLPVGNSNFTKEKTSVKNLTVIPKATWEQVNPEESEDSKEITEKKYTNEEFQKLIDKRKAEANAKGINPSVLAPANDACASAVALTSGVGTAGTNVAATVSASDPTATCASWFFGYWFYETVWYKITIASSSTINVQLTSGSISAPGVTIFSGACGSMTQVKCKQSANPNTTTTCLAAGTYYIMVWDDLTGAPGTFTITATATACSATNNGTCSSPYNISNIDGTWNTGFSTAANWTSDASHDTYGYACWSRNQWFTFTAQGPNIEITVNAASTCLCPEITLWSSNPCGGGVTEIGLATYQACISGVGYSSISLMNNNPNAAAPAYFTLTAGQQYWFSVSGNNCSTTYSVQVNNPLPTCCAGTNCINGTTICANGTYNGSSNLWGDQELGNSTVADCNLGQEINSSWYYLNVLTGGTLTFTLSPNNTNDDYDYAIYSGNDCSLSSAPVSCNFSGTTGNTGISTASGGTANSTPASGIVWNKDITVSAGTYLMLINGYTPSAGSYNFTFGGTAVLGCTTPTVLPVELFGFKANYNSLNTVDIAWNTASEKNSRSFTVERSKDAVNFEFLTKVDGAGNSDVNKKYKVTDSEPYDGTSYYRLKHTDFNGKTEVFNYVTLQSKKSQASFSVKPNPVTSKAEVEYNCKENETATIRIYNSVGNVVFENIINCTAGKNSTMVDFETLPSGLYVLTLSTPSEVHQTRIVK